MSWIHPNLLWALALIAVPILVHLFYFRRYKKIIFSDIRFLEQVKKETNRFSRLKNLLALLMRALAIIALVFAFAQPYLSKKNEHVETDVVDIYIDNSLSMSAEKMNASLLEIAKQKASEIVRAYGNQIHFNIRTNELIANTSGQLTQDAALDIIKKIRLTTEPVNLENLYRRQIESKPKSSRTHSKIYWISDFQKNENGAKIGLKDSLLINCLPIRSVSRNNVALDTAYFLEESHKKGQNSSLIFHMKNYGADPVSGISCSMFYNDSERPVGRYDIATEETIVDTVAVPILSSGWQKLILQIDDYPISFDDKLYLSFEVKKKHTILAINRTENNYLQNLFEAESGIQITQTRWQSIDYNRIKDYDLIILEDLPEISTGLQSQLLQYNKDGGQLLIFPPEKASLESYNPWLAKLNHSKLAKWNNSPMESSDINLNEALFKNVYVQSKGQFNLPTAQAYHPLKTNARGTSRSLIKFRNGDSFLELNGGSNGLSVLSAAPLNLSFNNLIKQGEILVPLVYNLTTSQAHSPEAYQLMGESKEWVYRIDSIQTESAFALKSEGGDIIPTQRKLGQKLYIQLNHGPYEAGFYPLAIDGREVGPLIALNLNRGESILEFYEEDELRSLSKGNVNIIESNLNMDIGAIIRDGNTAKQWWKYLLMAALVFLILETLILRIRS